MLHRKPIEMTLIALLAMGCGGGDGGGDTGGAAGEGEAGAAAQAEPAGTSSVTGMVMFNGTPPAGTPIDMSEEPVCAEKHASQPMTQEVVVSNGHLANVFVFVSEGLGDRTFVPSGDSVELDQEGCRYHPHVLGVQTGQNLVIKNSDAVLHNINTQSTANRPFNVSQPQAGMQTARTFNTPEVMIPVKCDVHGWMNAYIGVTGHPYHAVTGSDGTFRIEGLPAGTYTIEAWHETLGAQTMEVTVGDGESATADFTYEENAAYAPVPMAEPIVIRHDDGHAAG